MIILKNYWSWIFFEESSVDPEDQYEEASDNPEVPEGPDKEEISYPEVTEYQDAEESAHTKFPEDQD